MKDKQKKLIKEIMSDDEKDGLYEISKEMKTHKFKEIVLLLSIIVCLICYSLNIWWLFYIFLLKIFLDTISLLLKFK